MSQGSFNPKNRFLGQKVRTAGICDKKNLIVKVSKTKGPLYFEQVGMAYVQHYGCNWVQHYIGATQYRYNLPN